MYILEHLQTLPFWVGGFGLELWDENTTVVTILCTQNVPGCSALVPDDVPGSQPFFDKPVTKSDCSGHASCNNSTLQTPLYMRQYAGLTASTGSPDSRVCEPPFASGTISPSVSGTFLAS